MIESFVDLTYRGLQLGRRIKLTQVRPSTGYLELPAPMPVGTAIQIATDEGVVLDAIVLSIHEQVGRSDHAPGMIVRPVFDDTEEDPYPAPANPREWWRARVALPEEPPAVPRARPVTVRPRSHTTPQPPAASEAAASTTNVMAAVDQELLEDLTRKSGDIEHLQRRTGEHEVVDDGKRTTVMDAMDPAALGLDDDETSDNPTDDKKSPAGKKRRKRR